MTSAISPKVAIIGCDISGAVCASTLAKNGFSVTIFDLGRGPGGRMSQRETAEDGRELLFDHGAPYFSVTNPGVLDIIHEWESKGLASEWKERFGSFDCFSSKFIDHDEESSRKRYVGTPGMNSICKGLCNEPGIESKFGVGVGKLKWMADQNLWSLTSLDGQLLGNCGSLIATDKLLANPNFTYLKGQPLPIDVDVPPQLASRMQDIPARPCFALMLAFTEPLQSVRESENQ